jgi:hypothetical protein
MVKADLGRSMRSGTFGVLIRRWLPVATINTSVLGEG